MDNHDTEKRQVIEVFPTVSRERTKGREGVLRGKDGRIIYNDSWLHADLMEDDVADESENDPCRE